MNLYGTVVGHDDYEASYYFTVPDDYESGDYDWTQEQWIMRCFNREAKGLDHYGFMATPIWISAGINALGRFVDIEHQRESDRRNIERMASRG